MHGYLVLNGFSRPMVLGTYTHSPVILMNGSEGTLFRTYDQARCAIRRTHRYAKRQGIEWGEYTAVHIMRVEWRES